MVAALLRCGPLLAEKQVSNHIPVGKFTQSAEARAGVSPARADLPGQTRSAVPQAEWSVLMAV